MNLEIITKLIKSQNIDDVVLGISLSDKIFEDTVELQNFLCADLGYNGHIDIYSEKTSRNIRVFGVNAFAFAVKIYPYTVPPSIGVKKYDI